MIFAPVAAYLWEVTPDNVVGSAAGFGTVASRSTVTLSATLFRASERLREKVFVIAGSLPECATVDLELRAGGVCVVDAGVEETVYWQPPRGAMPSTSRSSRWTAKPAELKLTITLQRMIAAPSRTQCSALAVATHSVGRERGWRWWRGSPPVATANAVCDAPASFRVEINTAPIRPEQLLRAGGTRSSDRLRSPVPDVR
jgi:CO/xanthine dehydrogenase Mo-binding subunit